MSRTRKLLLLNLLEQAGERGVTTGEILAAGVGSRYGARLLELREDGWTIESKRERQSSFRYILLPRYITPAPVPVEPPGTLFTPAPRRHYDDEAA